MGMNGNRVGSLANRLLQCGGDLKSLVGVVEAAPAPDLLTVHINLSVLIVKNHERSSPKVLPVPLEGTAQPDVARFPLCPGNGEVSKGCQSLCPGGIVKPGGIPPGGRSFCCVTIGAGQIAIGGGPQQDLPFLRSPCLRFPGRGGSMTIVGQSGVGKSAFAMQFGLMAATGRAFFGISVKDPLRVAFIQAENDMGDMAEAFQGVIAGMKFGQHDMETLEKNVRFYDEQTKTGEEFVALARKIIVQHKAQLVIVDPLLAYAGNDISEQSFMSSFLRNQINPVLSDTGAIWVWLHHMPKPPRGDQSTGTISDLAYAGAGSADLTNWSREVAVLKREEGDGTPTFTFTLTKRGKRAGMVNNDGEPSKSIRLSHGDSGIVWEYAAKKMFVANREQTNKKQPKILKP